MHVGVEDERVEARGHAEELPDAAEHRVEQRHRHADLDPGVRRLGGDARLHAEVHGAQVPLQLADRAQAALADEPRDARAELILRLAARQEAHEAPRAVLDDGLGEDGVELGAHPAREIDERRSVGGLLEDDLEERGVLGERREARAEGDRQRAEALGVEPLRLEGLQHRGGELVRAEEHVAQALGRQRAEVGAGGGGGAELHAQRLEQEAARGDADVVRDLGRGELRDEPHERAVGEERAEQQARVAPPPGLDRAEQRRREPGAGGAGGRGDAALALEELREPIREVEAPGVAGWIAPVGELAHRARQRREADLARRERQHLDVLGAPGPAPPAATASASAGNSSSNSSASAISVSRSKYRSPAAASWTMSALPAASGSDLRPVEAASSSTSSASSAWNSTPWRRPARACLTASTVWRSSSCARVSRSLVPARTLARRDSATWASLSRPDAESTRASPFTECMPRNMRCTSSSETPSAAARTRARARKASTCSSSSAENSSRSA